MFYNNKLVNGAQPDYVDSSVPRPFQNASMYYPSGRSNKKNSAIIASASSEDYENEEQIIQSNFFTDDLHASLILFNRGTQKTRKKNAKRTAKALELRKVSQQLELQKVVLESKNKKVEAVKLLVKKQEDSEKNLARQFANSSTAQQEIGRHSSSRIADNDAAFVETTNANNSAVQEIVSAIVNEPAVPLLEAPEDHPKESVAEESIAEETIAKPPEESIEESPEAVNVIFGKRVLSNPESSPASKRLKTCHRKEDDETPLQSKKVPPSPRKGDVEIAAKPLMRNPPPPPPRKGDDELTAKPLMRKPPPPPRKSDGEIATKPLMRKVPPPPPPPPPRKGDAGIAAKPLMRKPPPPRKGDVDIAAKLLMRKPPPPPPRKGVSEITAEPTPQPSQSKHTLTPRKSQKVESAGWCKECRLLKRKIREGDASCRRIQGSYRRIQERHAALQQQVQEEQKRKRSIQLENVSLKQELVTLKQRYLLMTI